MLQQKKLNTSLIRMGVEKNDGFVELISSEVLEEIKLFFPEDMEVFAEYNGSEMIEILYLVLKQAKIDHSILTLQTLHQAYSHICQKDSSGKEFPLQTILFKSLIKYFFSDQFVKKIDNFQLSKALGVSKDNLIVCTREDSFELGLVNMADKARVKQILLDNNVLIIVCRESSFIIAQYGLGNLSKCVLPRQSDSKKFSYFKPAPPLPPRYPPAPPEPFLFSKPKLSKAFSMEEKNFTNIETTEYQFIIRFGGKIKISCLKDIEKNLKESNIDCCLYGPSGFGISLLPYTLFITKDGKNTFLNWVKERCQEGQCKIHEPEA